MPHLLRNPGDVRFVPVSILFGYFHNLIKLYGCITVTEVCFVFPFYCILFILFLQKGLPTWATVVDTQLDNG